MCIILNSKIDLDLGEFCKQSSHESKKIKHHFQVKT